jgi:hypothetical protein
LVEQDIWQYMMEMETARDVNYLPVLLELRNLLIPMDAVFMDMYAMARFFRVQEWQPSTDVLFYAGSGHIGHYQEFLYEKYDLEPNVIYKDREQCITGDALQRVWGDYL